MLSIIARALIVLGALWCAAGVTAVFVQPTGNNAPAARAESPAPAIEQDVPAFPKADRIAFAKFDERWTEPAKPVDLKVNASVGREPPSESRGSRPNHHHVDRVCGERGRRYFRRHHHLSWRCRR
jgi:hypothetical protein